MGSLIYPQFQQADLIGALQAAQQYRVQEAQLAAINAEAMAKQRAMAEQPELMRLQGEALQGRQGALQQLQLRAPKLAMDTTQYMTEQEKREREGLEGKRKEIVRQFDRQIALLQQAQQAPELLPKTLQYMVSQKLMPPEMAQQITDPRALAPLIGELRVQKTMWDDPSSADKLNDFQKMLAYREGIQEYAPGEKLKLTDTYIDALSKKGGGGGLEVNIDRSGATSATATAAQKDIRDNLETLATLRTLDATFDENFVTTAGTARRTLFGWLNKLTGISVDLEFRSAARKWFQEREQFFNNYKKLISGSAVSDREMEGLKESILSKDTPPDEVRASIRQLADKIDRDMGIAQDILRNGVPTTKSAFDAEYSRRYTEMKLADTQRANDSNLLKLRQDYNAHHKSLVDAGKSDEEAKRLTQEKFADELNRARGGVKK
jgi:hypothetical protein